MKDFNLNCHVYLKAKKKKKAAEKDDAADKDDADQDDKDEAKGKKKQFPERYVEPGLWRIKDAKFRVSTLSFSLTLYPAFAHVLSHCKKGTSLDPAVAQVLTCFLFLFYQDIVITPSQVGLPLCKWCRRPIKTDVKRHQNRCFWCSTCDDFVAADVARHRCTVPDADAIACPICGSINKNNNHLRHLRQVHPDVDAELYRRSSESTTQRDRRLKREGKVWNITCFKLKW